MFNNKNNRYILLQLALIFILIEILDTYLDYILGITFVHTTIQIVLYLILFLISFYLFDRHYKKKIKVLLTPELMKILLVINSSTCKQIMPNNKYLLLALKITKPTLKKRLDALTNLEYIYYEKKGNNKYLKLTAKGKLLIK